MLRLERVSKLYKRPDGSTVGLKDVSIELGRGELMGVFGSSGAGKTTLLRVAAGLCVPDGGTVTYNGELLQRMSAAERTRFRRREIACAWASQSWQEQLQVRDHVALPLLVDRCPRRNAERRVREALLACEVEQCLEMRLHELSDGERQRVSLARAIVTEPQLLLADGPASNLSPVEQEGVMALLSELAHKGRVAVLITASDAQALLRADPILYLRSGELITPEAAEERAKVYHLPVASRRAAADA